MNALFWLLRRSFRNWLVLKITRLKQPKYAISTVFLGLYFCMIFAPLAFATGDGLKPGERSHAREMVQVIPTGLLMFSVLWAWIFGATGALTFTMPEAILLFPAPVSRRALLIMRIARTQLPVLISSVFFALAGRGFASTLSRGGIVVMNLLLFNAIFLNRMAAGLAQCPRPATGRPGLAAHAGKAAAIGVIAAIVLSFRPRPIEPSLDSILGMLGAWANTPPARYVLVPFRAFAAPAVAHPGPELVLALALPFGILVFLAACVLLSNVAFEETAVVQSESLKQRIDFIRRTGRINQQKGKVKKAPIPLPAFSGPVLALAWKNYLAVSRMPLVRVFLLTVLALGVAAWIPTRPDTRFLVAPLGIAAAWAAGFATFMGPDSLRSDLRASLRAADLVKTFPAAGWKVFLGEILPGPIILSYIQGVLLAIAGVFAHAAMPDVKPVTFVYAWLAAMLFLVPLDFLVFTVANGAAVLFPQWVQLGPQKERGAEAIGANMLVGIVRYLVLMVGVLPAGIVGGAAAWLGSAWFGPSSLPLAAALGGTIVAVEVAGMIRYFGGALERLDPSAEL